MLNITTACSLFLLEAGNALADTETESLLHNEYTQELKQGASHAWSTIFSTRFFKHTLHSAASSPVQILPS